MLDVILRQNGPMTCRNSNVTHWCCSPAADAMETGLGDRPGPDRSAISVVSTTFMMLASARPKTRANDSPKRQVEAWFREEGRQVGGSAAVAKVGIVTLEDRGGTVAAALRVHRHLLGEGHRPGAVRRSSSMRMPATAPRMTALAVDGPGRRTIARAWNGCRKRDLQGTACGLLIDADEDADHGRVGSFERTSAQAFDVDLQDLTRSDVVRKVAESTAQVESSIKHGGVSFRPLL